MGGAQRLLGELDAYLARHDPGDVIVIGRGSAVNPKWLLRRELDLLRYRPRRVIALNNVGPMAPGTERWVLLRNALHFLSAEEAGRMPKTLLTGVRRQSAIVGAALVRADVVVVPTAAMAQRVVQHRPAVAPRLVIRPHPVSAPAHSSVSSVGSTPHRLLCPVLFAPYKQMGRYLRQLDAAVAELALRPEFANVEILVTASSKELQEAGLSCEDGRMRAVGRLTVDELARLGASCGVVFYPSSLESFGYPLAEARVNRRHVIALDTPQVREVAGDALVGFEPDDVLSLVCALETALTRPLSPLDGNPFDPISYFDWLLDQA